MKKMPIILLAMSLVLSVLTACTGTSVTPQSGTASASNTSIQSTTAQTTTLKPTSIGASEPAKPQGELVTGFETFGNEGLIPWSSSLGAAPIVDLIYDMLIYWDNVNLKFIPGLAESWEVSPDAMTLTYHLRKGVQFHDGWGEFTSEDLKYNFEKHASLQSVGKTSQTRRIASMDTPDPYTLVLHFKDPYPTFYVELSVGNSGVMQGIACKKYIEAVGEEAASEKAVGTGPYKQIEHKSGDYYKFEAVDPHWRVVPEFKYLTVRLVPETSTLVAGLKSKELDLALVPAEQIVGLKSAGLDTEVSNVGGGLIFVSWGGMVIPEDKRYDPNYHNKDPWTDARVRKAMTVSIDREAICKAIYAGYADPAYVILYSTKMHEYQYPYDPDAAKQLLSEAGYPNGFSFEAVSFAQTGAPEMPRLMEALVGYWQQIGLDPKITMIDFAAYNNKYRSPVKTSGQVSLHRLSPITDMLARVELYLMPNVVSVIYEDEGSYAIWNKGPRGTIEERMACVDKLNQYYFDNYGPIPVVEAGYTYAWNGEKVLPWPHPSASAPYYLEYVRHAQPINTFRLFTPMPGR